MSEQKPGTLLATPSHRIATRDLELVVIGPEGSLKIVPVVRGTLQIGRRSPGSKVQMQLDDVLMSELHAAIHVDANGVEIEDKGSKNGTKLPERELRNERAPLELGGTARLGGTLLVLRAKPPPPRLRQVWGHHYFMGRVEEECSRSGASFAVVRLRAKVSRDKLAKELASALDTYDLLAHFGGEDYELLLFGASTEAAAGRAAHLRERLGHVIARLGAACFAKDGHTANELVAKASERCHGEHADVRRPLLHSPAMTKLYERATIVARAATPTVLVTGETGVGKEMLARHLHQASARASGPFVAVNCGAIQPTVAENEFFGHERGGFTSADQETPGKFELASGGTLFLDEIGELPESVQVKLLRAIQEGETMRVGGRAPVKVDVRLVAATNRDLVEAMRAKTFRADLYFRIATFVLPIPPLRQRSEDVAPLARTFVAEICAREKRAELPISEAALTLLAGQPWPGNVRELRNVIERTVILCGGDCIEPDDLQLHEADLWGPAPDEDAEVDAGASEDRPPPVLDGLPRQEARQAVVDALIQSGCVKEQAARLLGMSKGLLLQKMDEYGLPRPRAGKKT